MDIRTIIARNLIAYRRRAGLSQIELSEKGGVDRTTVGKIEQQIENPSALILHKIAHALAIAPMQLLADFDETGSLVVGRSIGAPDDESGEPDAQPKKKLAKRGRPRREDVAPVVLEHNIVPGGIVIWKDSVMELVEIDEGEGDLAMQTLANLEAQGFEGDELIDRFEKIFPRIKAIYEENLDN